MTDKMSSRSDPVTPTYSADIRSRYVTRSASRRAVRCRFFRNGDRFYSGYIIPVSVERYGTLENLSCELSNFLDHPLLPSGVKFIFTLDGEKITFLNQVCGGGDFVAASTDSFKKLDYQAISGNSSPSKKNGRRSREPGRMIAKSESFTTRIDDSSFDRDFIRARNISVFAHGNKPRKMSRVLLNKKTVHSMDGILDDISDSLGIGCAIKKLVSIPNGLAIQKLEDLFDHCTLFIAMTSTKAKLTPQDLQLHKDEIKTLPSKLTPRSRARPVTASRARSTSIQNSSKTTPKTSRSNITRSFSVGNQWPKEIQDRLIIGDKLGAGYFAEVRFALDRKNGEDVAVKIIDRLKCRGKENMIEAEIRIMKKVRHPFIVELLDDIKSQQNIFLIIELVRGGDLYDFITESESYCPRQACQFSYNLAAALHYLHSFRIIHRDIKPENLLVYSYPDETKILKICDFGLATEVRRSEKLSFICGTATYVAPEIITSNGYGVEVDIWAAGIIIYILLCGFPPFRSESGDQDDLFRIILRGEFEFPSPFWDDVDEEAKDLIIRILNQNTEERLSAEAILVHPWLKNPLNDFNQGLKPRINSRLNPAPSMPSLTNIGRFEAEI